MVHQPQAIRYPGAVELRFPWRPHIAPGLIERLKATIPSHSRTYEPATKTWVVYEPWCDQALALVRLAFPDTVVVGPGARAHSEGPRQPEPRPMATERHYAALHLLPSAPPALVRAAYLCLVKENHPDLLPAPEKDRAHRTMCEINASFEALRADDAA